MKTISTVNLADKVKSQYQNSSNLNIRIELHNKYSTNKMGISNWYFSIYEIQKGMKVMELGCGTGSMWTEHQDEMERCDTLVLSDLSLGMLNSAKENLGEKSNIYYMQIDIGDIPYEDETFDVVIANNMLYHVPDLSKGLLEVKRVLKKGGLFYSATAGEKGIMEAVIEMLHLDCQYAHPFSLQNGREMLSQYFSKVERRIYEDSLEVTNIDDMVEYLYSGISFCNLCTMEKEEVKEILSKNMVNGVLYLPKQPGMFISVK